MMLIKILPCILYGVSWLGLFGYGFYQGSEHTKEKYETMIKADTIAYNEQIINLQQEVLEKERQKNAEISEILAQNEENLNKERDQYEKTITDLRNGNAKLSGMLNDSNAKRTRTNKHKYANTQDVVCYERGELLQKVESTLRIGIECDKLANDYNALLEACEE